MALNCSLIEFPKISDGRGFLTVVESNQHIAFAIKRVFYVYDVPDDIARAEHAHKTLHEVVVALSGSIDVVVDDGKQEERFHLDQPNIGLYVPPLVWTRIVNFSPGAVCLVLASDFYDEGDYIRDYEAFKKTREATA